MELNAQGRLKTVLSDLTRQQSTASKDIFARISGTRKGDRVVQGEGGSRDEVREREGRKGELIGFGILDYRKFRTDREREGDKGKKIYQ